MPLGCKNYSLGGNGRFHTEVVIKLYKKRWQMLMVLQIGHICALNVKINLQNSKTFGRSWGFKAFLLDNKKYVYFKKESIIINLIIQKLQNKIRFCKTR